MSGISVPPGLFTVFPRLAAARIEVTSPRDARYNCVAWAAGESARWWWPDPQGTCFWPHGAPREESLAAFIDAFRSLGYETCSDGALEAACERIAIFALHGVPTHVARQLTSGEWTSKLGRSVDLSCALSELEGEVYGTVAQFMRRSIGPARA